MLIFRNLFFIASLIVLVCLIGCIAECLVKRTKIALTTLHIQVPIFISIVFCILFYFVKNATVAKLFWSFHDIFSDISLLVLLNFVILLEDIPKNNKGFKIHGYVFFCLAVCDAVLQFCNVKHENLYSVSVLWLDESFSTWLISFYPPFYFHAIICYYISGVIFIRLIFDAFTSAKIFKWKYNFIFFILAVDLFFNGAFVTKPEFWIFDYSVLIDGCLSVILFSFSIFSIPRYLQKNVLSLASANVSDAIICFNDKEHIIYRNKKAEIFNEENLEWLKPYFENNSDFQLKSEVINVDGKTKNYKVEFRKLRDTKNRLAGSYVKLSDRTKEVEKTRLEIYKATHDELTGLYTRNFFFSEMERILKAEPDVPRYLVSTDIKDFKVVNDLFGSEFGDKLLQRQAEMLKMANYEGVIYGRISGDRFAMLIQKENFRPDLAKVNTSNIKNLSKEINFDLKICIGVYEIADPFENVHTMYDKANLARNSIIDDPNQSLAIYDTSLMNKLLYEKKIVSNFSNALSNEQFKLYLQPQIDVKTGKCLGAEVLSRWIDSNNNMLCPSEYIHILEKSGQIYLLDDYNWKETAKILQDWKKRGIDLYLSVNISVKDFYHADLYKFFTQLVEKYNIEPSRLKLEITESVVIGDTSVYISILKKLQDYGFSVEMDDFGSGYASLSVLKNIPMDVLKIDMAFLSKTKNEERGKLIIESIVKMAKSLGMQVISEGVENEEQAAFLSKTGIDLFQGYLYSKPVPLTEFERMYLKEDK